MKKQIFLILLAVFIIGCDRPKEDRQGYREEQEEVTNPNDYTTGEDTDDRPPVNR